MGWELPDRRASAAIRILSYGLIERGVVPVQGGPQFFPVGPADRTPDEDGAHRREPTPYGEDDPQPEHVLFCSTRTCETAKKRDSR